jgi:hypothetical protein
MAELEHPDVPISMKRTGELAGLDPATLKQAAQKGRLAAIKPGHDWLTTRRRLDHYLKARTKSNAALLPDEYVPVVQDKRARIVGDDEERLLPQSAKRPQTANVNLADRETEGR